MKQFEVKKSYGNDLTIEVIKRSPKFLTIKTVFGENRVKIKDYCQGEGEYISFKCWMITSFEDFNREEATRLSMEKAYN